MGILNTSCHRKKKAKSWYQKALDAVYPDAKERLQILGKTKQYAETH